MKYLCLACDQPMKLRRNERGRRAALEGLDEGSLIVTIHCSECGCCVAMLTNPDETQRVQTHGVEAILDPWPTRVRHCRR